MDRRPAARIRKIRNTPADVCIISWANGRGKLKLPKLRGYNRYCREAFSHSRQYLQIIPKKAIKKSLPAPAAHSNLRRSLEGIFLILFTFPNTLSAHPPYPASPRADPGRCGQNGRKRQSACRWGGANPAS